MLEDFIATLNSVPASQLGWLGWVVVATFGLIWGSFLNVVIYRLPLMNYRRDVQDTNSAFETQLEVPEQVNLISPRSFCPFCGHTIPFYQNIPIVSFLILQGKCAYCGTRIPLRYPLVEVTGALLVLACVFHQENWVFAFIDVMLLSMLWTLFWTDFERGLLPDNLTLPLAFIGLGIIGTYAEYDPSISFADSVLGLLIGYCTLMLIDAVYQKLRGRVGIGRGDFKLFGALGCWFGWMMLPVILFCASLFALAFTLVTVKSRGLAYSRPVPLGAFLVLVGMFVVLAKHFDLNLTSLAGSF